MFTGIVETIGQITKVTEDGSNKIFWIESAISSELKADQSVAHDGVCLTVEQIDELRHRVTAVKETLEKTNLGQWQEGRFINLERALLPTNRLDGHFVQGHIDATGVCKKIKNKNGSDEFQFSFQKKFASLIIEKGSICINGVSLTVFDVKKNSFHVAIIPYTFEHTTFKFLKEDEEVNLEFDMIGKYIVRNSLLKKK